MNGGIILNRKRFLTLAILMLLTLTVAGCAIEVPPSNPEPEPGPEITIIFPEEELREYIRSARANAGDMDALYQEIVLDPVRQEMAARVSKLNLDDFQKPIHNLDELENALDLLVQNDAAGIVRTALERSSNFIQGVDTTVYIFPCNPEDSFTRDKMRGVRGVSGMSCGTTIISINPTAQGWREILPYVAAHEYHHVIWGSRCGHLFEGYTLEVLIMEGMADSFANMVYPDLAVPWTSTLTKDREREVWPQVKEKLFSTDLVEAKRITQDEYWSGYAIGYDIVQVYLYHHPELTPDQWTEVPIPEVYENSGYEDWLSD